MGKERMAASQHCETVRGDKSRTARYPQIRNKDNQPEKHQSKKYRSAKHQNKLLDDNIVNNPKMSGKSKTTGKYKTTELGPSKQERIQKVADEHRNDSRPTIFYHWNPGMTESGTLGKLIRGRLTEREISESLKGGLNSQQKAGPGLYLSSEIHDSSEYSIGTAGCLLEVSVPLGSVGYIDWDEVGRELKNGKPKVAVQDVGSNNAKILFRYQGTWYCLNTIGGERVQVTAKLFDGVGYQVDVLLAAKRNIKKHFKAAVAIFEGQLDPKVRRLYDEAKKAKREARQSKSL
jgi:hypothetical protein